MLRFLLKPTALCISTSWILYFIENTYFHLLGSNPHLFLSAIFCSSILVVYTISYYYPNQMTGAILGITFYKFTAILLYLILSKPLEKYVIIAFFSIYFVQLLLFITLVVLKISKDSKNSTENL